MRRRPEVPDASPELARRYPANGLAMLDLLTGTTGTTERSRALARLMLAEVAAKTGPTAARRHRSKKFSRRRLVIPPLSAG